MSPIRRIAPIALLLTLAAGASQAAWYVRFDGVDGELVADTFDVEAFGEPTPRPWPSRPS